MIPGDLIVLDTMCSGGGSITSYPSGFSQVLSIAGANNSLNQRFIATKFATAADAASGSLSTVVGGTPGGVLQVAYALRGVAVATPGNTGVYTTSGYITTLPPAVVTIANPGDLTLYGYGGVTSSGTGTPVCIMTGTGLANTAGNQFANSGCAQGIGWGTAVSAPGNATCGTGLDSLAYALDFAPLNYTPSGGQVSFTWILSGSVDNAVAAMSFSPPPPQVVASMVTM